MSHSTQHHKTNQTADGYYVHAHVSSTKDNLRILLTLFFFTALTVGAYRVRLGEWNLVAAIAIASVKAVLVGTFFMHLKYEKKFNILFFLGALIFMGVFFGYTINDTAYRGELDAYSGHTIDPSTGEYANGTPDKIKEHGEIAPLEEMNRQEDPSSAIEEHVELENNERENKVESGDAE